MSAATAEDANPKVIRVGIIGLDTSHAPAFAKEMNNPQAKDDVAGCRVVAAYPKGSADIESSVSRVPGYVAEFEKMGIEIVGSIEELLAKVDCVCLETNDGRPHLEQAIPVLKAKKPLFIDKPIAGSLADAVAIYRVAQAEQTPVWSSSSLRYAPGAQEIRNGAIGNVLGCDAYSPSPTEKTHPDLFWYGIHGVETLFTIMGPECESLTRIHSPDMDVVVGRWSSDRLGTFRGIRKGKTGYGGTAFGDKGIREIGNFGGYRPLVVEIVKFFKTRQVPVSQQETLAIYAFMEGADESKRQNGAEVKLADIMKRAEEAATKRLAELGKRE
jgi:predicted dehydrogenase